MTLQLLPARMCNFIRNQLRLYEMTSVKIFVLMCIVDIAIILSIILLEINSLHPLAILQNHHLCLLSEVIPVRTSRFLRQGSKMLESFCNKVPVKLTILTKTRQNSFLVELRLLLFLSIQSAQHCLVECRC